MTLRNYYWYFTSALTPRFCDEVIKQGLGKQETIATTGQFGNGRDLGKNPLTEEEIKILKCTRDSNVTWIGDPWIYNEIHPYIRRANKSAGWNYQWSRSESCQFTKYKHNQFYGWHTDSWEKPNEAGQVRKLSVICQLTDGSKYEGGELEFDFRNYDPNVRDQSIHVVREKKIAPRGSIIVFPSHVWHQVKPITNGSRYSLVLWNLGSPFK